MKNSNIVQMKSQIHGSKSINILQGHWSQDENAKYYAFIFKFPQQFEEKYIRRQCKVFKTLSLFMNTRNSNQCRGHHHKMLKHHDKVTDILAYLRKQNPDIQQKSLKYNQTLQGMTFADILYSNQRRKVSYNQLQNYYGPNNYLNTNQKARDISFVRTGLTYIPTSLYPQIKIQNPSPNNGQILQNFESVQHNNIHFNGDEFACFPKTHLTEELQNRQRQSQIMINKKNEQQAQMRNYQETLNYKIEDCYNSFMKWHKAIKQIIQQEAGNQIYYSQD